MERGEGKKVDSQRWIGFQLGDYELLELVGEGGMGIVYRARQRSLGRIVAVKVLRPELRSERAWARFRREAKTVARLTHPNIVKLFEFQEMEHGLFYSMEYIEGQSLVDVARESFCSNQDVRRIGLVLAEALSYAHRFGVVHRDLKPANILLDAESVVKVVDFGIARYRDEESRLTRVGDVIGSPNYLSPEQLNCGNDTVTVTTDIYGVGAVLYELLTGRPPFAAASLEETLRLISSVSPQPPRQLNPDADAGLERICLRCLNKRPDERYRSAEELGFALAQGRGELPLLVESDVDDSESVPGGRSSMTLAVGLSLLVLLGGVLNRRFNTGLEPALGGRGVEREQLDLNIEGEGRAGQVGSVAEPPFGDDPVPQSGLQRFLEFEWSAAPPFPQGVQDNDGGICHGFLVMVGGFCHGFDDDWKPGMYPRGFLNNTWALNLAAGEAWIDLPGFPGVARQEMLVIAVADELYVWGGMNDTAPFTYADGYRLALADGRWQWARLPDLPYPIAGSCLAAVGKTLYLVGGMDYDGEVYYVATNRGGEIDRFGSRLYELDTNRMDMGWRELPSCPGTPRMMPGIGVVNSRVYVMGGYGIDRHGRSHSVVDNWRFDPVARTWSRLRDLPVSVSGFGSGQIVYKERYLILSGGVPHETVLNPDGTAKARYGTPSSVDRSQWRIHRLLRRHVYANHIWVYDTLRDVFGTGSPLPYDDHGPAIFVVGDVLYEMPSETGGFWFDGEYFGHAPEFVLRGKITETRWASELSRN